MNIENPALSNISTNNSLTALPEASTSNSMDEELKIGDRLYEEGRYSEAFAIYKKILETITSFHGNQSIQAALLYQKLGLALFKKANYNEACDYLAKALEIRKDL